jgi:polyisoprenyl-teichoic acid--peptidoglycan teichoic acid transferase
VAQLTGTEVPYYLLISPEGVREIVDSMGGVEIEVPEAVSGRASSTGSEITLSPGPQTLDGDRVLLYLQGKDLRDDVERAERQRDFLHALFRQALRPSNLLSNPATLPTVLKHTQTNMGSVKTVQLANRIRALEDSDAPIETGTVPAREETAHSEQDDTQLVYWVPDAQELPKVLEKTVQ